MSTATVEREPIQASLPARLLENPYGLVSLLEMLKFYAETFCDMSCKLGQIYMDARHGAVSRKASWSLVRSSIAEVEKQCKAMGLPVTLAQIERVSAMIAYPWDEFPFDRFIHELFDIQSRLTDELRAKKLYALNSQYSRFFDNHQFDDSVIKRFPNAVFDITEAGKCFAVERATASVFHLMRVLEHGLDVVSKFFPTHNPVGPNWDQIIKKIDSELKRPYSEREFKGQKTLLSGVSAHINAVKVAWRDDTMHIANKYTMEEAGEIYDAIRGLMRYLAGNLPLNEGEK